jgi:hypothetical protein
LDPAYLAKICSRTTNSTVTALPESRASLRSELAIYRPPIRFTEARLLQIANTVSAESYTRLIVACVFSLLSLPNASGVCAGHHPSSRVPLHIPVHVIPHSLCNPLSTRGGMRSTRNWWTSNFCPAPEQRSQEQSSPAVSCCSFNWALGKTKVAWRGFILGSTQKVPAVGTGALIAEFKRASDAAEFEIASAEI